MKRLISAIAALSLLFGAVTAGAADTAETDTETAVETEEAVEDEVTGGMLEITSDMIVESDGSGITAEMLAEELFTVDMSAADDELAAMNALDVSSYTIDFGEEAPTIRSFRCFVAGNGVRGGITVYGSAHYSGFNEIGAADTTLGGEWNDITLATDVAYRYIRVVCEEEETTDSDPNDTASSAGTETTADDDDEEEDGSTSVVDTGTSSAAVDTPARAVKAVFIEAGEEDLNADDNTEDTSGTHQGVGAAGGLGFYGSKFPDCQGHWAEEIIIECTDKNYLDGYEDGNFRPDNPVTAAEFAKIYSAWNGNFYTVSSGYWAMPFIRELINTGVFEIGDFEDYSAYMTREQCAKAIINSLTAEYFPADLTEYEQYITDFDEVSEGYGEYVLKAYVSGILSGYDDGTFRPKEYVTRAEILTIIDRAMNAEKREIPEAAQNATSGAAETQTYYTAAVQVRKTTNANSMNFRLYGSNAQYMVEDDTANGLKLFDEFQGAQGMAFLMRFDLSDIIERESELTSIKFIINRHSNGDMPLGLFMYEEIISQTDWNDSSYMEPREGGAVAAEDRMGYNAVCDNISAILPTWGDMENAVPQEEKTQPFAQAELDENNQYVFDLDLATLKENMDENNVVEFFATSVNYDRYGMEEDNKPRCYVAGELAPQIYCTFSTGAAAVSGPITLMPEDAELFGGMLNLEDVDGVSNIANFTTGQSVEYTFSCSAPGTYKLTMNYSANQGSGGGTAKIKVNDTEISHEFTQTGSWTSYEFEEIGEFELTAGENTLTVSEELIPNTYLINIREVILEKVN